MSDLVAVCAAILISYGWTCPQENIDKATIRVQQDEKARLPWAAWGVYNMVKHDVCTKPKRK